MTDHKDSDTTTNDFDFSRAMYYSLLEKGNEALVELMEFAVDNPHPRSFEVLATMIKNLSDVNGNLIDLQKKYKDLQGNGDDTKALPSPEGGNVTNNMFVGSTKDLQEMLKKHKENAVIDVTPKDHEDSA